MRQAASRTKNGGKRIVDHVIDEIYRVLGKGRPRQAAWLVEERTLDAQDFGLPQSRPRVYITGRRRERILTTFGHFIVGVERHARWLLARVIRTFKLTKPGASY